MKRHSVLCSILFLCTSPLLNAQGFGLSGDIRVTITDHSGAVMQKVSVAVVRTETGLRYTAATDLNGPYRMTALGPGTYEVSAAMPGFETQVHKTVAVNIGETVVVDFRLRVSPRSETVEVMSELPVVDTARGSQANMVEQQVIRDLPIDRHGYLPIAGGVGSSNTIASNADYRVKQTPQSGLSFYGSNGRGNNITVDGAEANEDTGGVRLTLSQGAVEEFQVNRSNYSAELGSASGASLNIASRSGTNNLHSSFYGYFRNMRLSRSFRIGEQSALRITAEGFNTTNQINYASLNNLVVAAFAPPFKVRGTSAVSPSQPLGFTAAFPKREVQFGIRFEF